jgi:hypothetical protein
MEMMKKSWWSGLLLGSVVWAGSAVGAQPVLGEGMGQVAENAGHPKTNVAQAGNGIKQGTKKVYHKTAQGTKKVFHKTGHGVAQAGDKMQGKPSPQ